MHPENVIRASFEDYDPIVVPLSEQNPEQRAEFDLRNVTLDEFINSILTTLMYGYSNASGKTSLTKIVSLALQNNIDLIGGIYPNFRINYHDLQVSKGKLEKPIYTRIYQIDDTTARLEWDRFVPGNARRTDKVFWVQYNATTNESIIWEDDKVRTKGFTKIKLDEKIVRHELHYWIFFTSSNGRLRSDSVYLGQLNTSTLIVIHNWKTNRQSATKKKCSY